MSPNKPQYYTSEFRISSAKLAVESGQSVAQTARELGIKAKTLHGWVSKYAKPKGDNMQQKQSNNLKIQQLEKQLALVTQERDLLKKAAAYFAAQSQ